MKAPENEAGPVVGCSVRGPSHEDDDTPCQDSWNSSQLSDDHVVIAVGDGLGSASHSHIGSEIATQEAVSALGEHIEANDLINESIVDEVFREAFKQARRAIREKADELEVPASELQTTLLATVAGPSGVAGAAVGDGGIVYEHDGEYHLFVEREMNVVDLPSSEVTHPLVSDEWPSYRSNYISGCDGLIVFSDGLDEFAWAGLESANSEFFDAVFEIVHDLSEAKEASEKMAEILNNDNFRRFGDDKTIAVGNFPPDLCKDEIQMDEDTGHSEN